MTSSRAIFPLVVIASMAITLALFWPRLGEHGPNARRIPHPSLPVELAPSSREPIVAPSASAPLPVASLESAQACPEGMILVEGEHCPFVAHKCRKERKDSDVCELYAAEVLCEGTIRPTRFCIDELEYPNLVSVKPVVLVSFQEAKRACEVEDKRLCTVDEWQFSCEGEAIFPLPSSIERSATACNVDRLDPPPVLGALRDPFEVAGEMVRIDGRVPSGTLSCVSSFGVRDLVGNVEEWADNPNGSANEKPFRSAVVGGAWGRGAATCRTVDLETPETFTSHHRGFRCCSDASRAAERRNPHAPHKSPGGFRPLPVKRG